MSQSQERFELRKGWYLLSTCGTSQSGDQMRLLAERFVAEAKKDVALASSRTGVTITAARKKQIRSRLT